MEVLFVCTGNTCRSVMAEAIFNSINTLKNFHSSSAGVFVPSGSVTTKNAAEVTQHYLNVDISKRRAVQISKEMVEKSDLVLAMTNDIKDILCNSFSDYKYKIHTLNKYASVEGCISDPYGGDRFVYENTFFQIKDNILNLISRLKEDGSIY